MEFQYVARNKSEGILTPEEIEWVTNKPEVQMAEYQFTAQNLKGKRFKATMAVPTVSDVVSRLKTQNLMALKIQRNLNIGTDECLCIQLSEFKFLPPEGEYGHEE